MRPSNIVRWQCHVYDVTVGGIWIGNWVYWTILTYDSWLHFTYYCYIHTTLSSVTFFTSLLVTASNDRSSPFSGFPTCPVPQPQPSSTDVSQKTLSAQCLCPGVRQSHVATDSKSFSLVSNPCVSHDQILVTIWRLCLSPCEAPSLTRGESCYLSQSN
jgi:hypothetical protein